jgi:antigen 43
MSSPASFLWIGTVNGDWNAPANWADVTTGQTPAISVPGDIDSAVINNGTVTGIGDAASLIFLGTNTILGRLNVGTLALVSTISAPAGLYINSDATVSAYAASETGTIAVSGECVLSVSGPLDVGASTSAGLLSATDGALIQMNDLTFGVNPGSQISVDKSSTIEIGNAGAAAAGALTIDSMHVLSGPGFINADLVNEGLINSDQLTLGQPLTYAGGNGSSSYEGSEFTSSMSGTGTVEVGVDGLITLQEPVPAGGLTFLLDGTSDLNIDASVSAQNTIDLVGDSDTLTINDQYYLEEHPGGPVGQDPYFTGGPPTVDAIINGFNSSDAFKFVDDPFLGLTITSASYTGSVLTLLNGSSIVSTFNLSGTYSGDSISIGAPNDLQQIIKIACFNEGTRILTSEGEKFVQDLKEGDLVIVLRANRPSQEQVKWVGHRTIPLSVLPRPDLAAPIRIRRDAIGPSLPHRDLLLSPDHCLLIDEKLIPAWMLLNEMTIVQECNYKSVQYFHVELHKHGIIIAEGLPVESYLDTGNRAMFANAGLAVLLHPDFELNQSLRTWNDDACAPLTVTSTVLGPIWTYLADRAELSGFTPPAIQTDNEPHLKIVTAGKTISPIWSSAKEYIFILPMGTNQLILSSRSTQPSAIVRYLDDRRWLGVAVCNLTIRIGMNMMVLAADHLPIGTGWHECERAVGEMWRWTNGAGELLLDPLPEAAILQIGLSGSARYIVDRKSAAIAA